MLAGRITVLLLHFHFCGDSISKHPLTTWQSPQTVAWNLVLWTHLMSYSAHAVSSFYDRAPQFNCVHRSASSFLTVRKTISVKSHSSLNFSGPSAANQRPQCAQFDSQCALHTQQNGSLFQTHVNGRKWENAGGAEREGGWGGMSGNEWSDCSDCVPAVSPIRSLCFSGVAVSVTHSSVSQIGSEVQACDCFLCGWLPN